jgi:hypothetical protein
MTGRVHRRCVWHGTDGTFRSMTERHLTSTHPARRMQDAAAIMVHGATTS